MYREEAGRERDEVRERGRKERFEEGIEVSHREKDKQRGRREGGKKKERGRRKKKEREK